MTRRVLAAERSSVSDFWDDFATHHWGRRPVVLRPPFPVSLGTMDEVFAGCLEAGRRIEKPRRVQRVRAFVGLDELHDVPQLLPRASDHDMHGYVQRMCQAHADRGFGLMIMQFQSSHDAIWRRTTAFLAELERRIGIQPGGAALDLFTMNQHRGFTGVHKDSQDVFTCVVSGRKRMLLWPFERLADRPSVKPTDRLRSARLGQICDDELRAEAIVLDAEPGDIMYWPCDYWHISEVIGGPVTTLGLGVIRTGDMVEFLQTATASLHRELTTPPAPVPDVGRVGLDGTLAWLRRTIDAAIADPRIETRIEDEFMHWLTSHGFGEVPALTPPVSLADDDWIAGCGPRLFVWRQRGGRLVISSHGKPLELPAHPALVDLCARIGEAATIRVGAFLDDATGSAPPADRDAVRVKLRGLLGLLARARAVAAVAAPDETSLDQRSRAA